MKIGLFGDSFGYQKGDQPFSSWVDLLSQHYEINNHCQCGVSEYKILQQLKNADLSKYNQIIITHTSPTRTFIRYNPLHQDSLYHKNCDIILSDIEQRNDQFSQACKQYFRYIFDYDYALDIHNMICKEINTLTCDHQVLHITHFDYSGCGVFDKLLNFYPTWIANRGEVNHYNQEGNLTVYKTIMKEIS